MWVVEIVTAIAGFLSGYFQQKKTPLWIVFLISFCIFSIIFFIAITSLPEKAEWVDLSSIILGSCLLAFVGSVCVILGVKYDR